MSRSEWLIVNGDKIEIFIRLLRWCVWSVLLYGNDAWMINAYTKNYLKAIDTIRSVESQFFITCFFGLGLS